MLRSNCPMIECHIHEDWNPCFADSVEVLHIQVWQLRTGKVWIADSMNKCLDMWVWLLKISLAVGCIWFQTVLCVWVWQLRKGHRAVGWQMHESVCMWVWQLRTGLTVGFFWFWNIVCVGLTTQNRSCCVLLTVQNLCSMSTHYKPAVPRVHRFTGGPNGFQQCEVPIILKTLHHIALLCYCFKTKQLHWKTETDIITNTWTHWTKGSPMPAMTVQEIYFLLAVTVQKRHGQRDELKDYWSTLEQFYMACCKNTMKWQFHSYTQISTS
jgi:hypothetical protein